MSASNKFLPVLLSLLCPILLQAQMVMNGSTGTSNSTFLMSNHLAVHNQHLYRPADLSNAQTGEITKLYYRYGTTAEELGNTVTDLKIRMGQTTATAFQSGNIYFTDLQMVLHAPTFVIEPGETGEWFTVPIETPFGFDPQKTLIIDIMFDSSSVTNLGFFGTNNNGRKLRSPDTTSTTGFTTSTTWQDMGFDLDTHTGIVQMRSNGIGIRPNPFADGFDVFLNGLMDDGRLELFDISGRSILSRSIARHTEQLRIDLAGHPAGVYFVRIEGGDGAVVTQKVLKE